MTALLGSEGGRPSDEIHGISEMSYQVISTETIDPLSGGHYKLGGAVTLQRGNGIAD